MQIRYVSAVYKYRNCSGLTSVIAEIEKPFAFGNSSFDNISPSCTLTVPYGTKDAYIAAGWTEDIFKGGIIEAPEGYLYLNRVSKSLFATDANNDAD